MFARWDILEGRPWAYFEVGPMRVACMCVRLSEPLLCFKLPSLTDDVVEEISRPNNGP